MKKNIFTHIHTYINESLCCTPETNIVNQLYFNQKKKKNPNPKQHPPQKKKTKKKPYSECLFPSLNLSLKYCYQKVKIAV